MVVVFICNTLLLAQFAFRMTCRRLDNTKHMEEAVKSELMPFFKQMRNLRVRDLFIGNGIQELGQRLNTKTSLQHGSDPFPYRGLAQVCGFHNNSDLDKLSFNRVFLQLDNHTMPEYAMQLAWNDLKVCASNNSFVAITAIGQSCYSVPQHHTRCANHIIFDTLCRFCWQCSMGSTVLCRWITIIGASLVVVWLLQYPAQILLKVSQLTGL